MKIRVGSAVLTAIISLQIGFGIPMVVYATPASKKPLTAEDFAAPLIKNLMLDPVFAEFAKQPALPAPQIAKNDPALDQDPFFLRSQEWTPARGGTTGSSDAEASFTKENDQSITLTAPHARKSLRLRVPLTPVLVTEEHVFLTLDQGSDIFEKASGPLGKDERVGEGVFFFNYKEWLEAAAISAPVKIYFFPLPGHGWTGPIEADHYSDMETISLGSSEGDWVPVSEGDIRQVEKVQALNALLGGVVALQSGTATTSSPQQFFPARGSTYGFGMLFTGYDLDSRSVSGLGSGLGFDFDKALDLLSGKVGPLWATILKTVSIPEAKADMNLSGDLINSLIRFGWTFGALLSVAVALKYTLLKEKFSTRRSLRDLRTVPVLEFDIDNSMKLVKNGIRTRAELGNASVEAIQAATGLDAEKANELRTSANQVVEVIVPEATTRLGRAKQNFDRGTRKLVQKTVPEPVRRASKTAYREVVEIGDSLASVMTTATQVPGVLTANFVERMADRYFPEAAAADNKLLRKILNYNFLWGRAVSTNTPVSMKTFMLGAVVMGTVDTYIVYVQQVAFIPWMAEKLLPHLPPALAERVYETYDPANEQTRSLIVNDIVRNFVGWISSGASGYSQETQGQVEPLVRKQVDDALKKMGKNPLAPEVQEERERLYNDVMNAKLKQLGLPDKMDFLFDVSTVDKVVLKKLGFRLSDVERDSSGEKSFLGESRPALIKSSLERAIELEKESLKQAPNEAKIEALKILESTRRLLTLFSLDLKHPVRSLQARRDLTRMLSLLTYSGDVDTVVRHVPDVWTGMSPEGAREAAIRFRQAFFSFYTGDGTLMNLPESFISTHIDEAKKLATEELGKKYPFAQLETVHRAEFGLLVEQKLREKFARQKKSDTIANYKHPKMSWYQNVQHQRAYRKTMERALGDTANTPQETLNRYYAEAMANEVGVYPKAMNDDERRMLEYVLLRTQTDTASELGHEPLKSHLERISVAERSQIELSLFAKNYLDNYRSATIDQNLVPPRSPAQPGFTQRFRQNHKDSRILTILARVVDSGFSDEVGFQTGLQAKLYRNVPAAYDLISSVQRLGKYMLTGTTVKWEYARTFWGVNIPFASFFLLYLVSPLTSAPSQWMNRMFRQQGIQPMGGVMSKIAYGIPYAWVTFGSMIPWILYSKDAILFTKALGTAIAVNPMFQTLSSLAGASLPWLPALAVIPVINEIRARRANRQAFQQAKSLVEEQRSREASGTDTAARGAPSSLASPASTAGGRTCEALFQPTARAN